MIGQLRRMLSRLIRGTRYVADPTLLIARKRLRDVEQRMRAIEADVAASYREQG